MWVRPRQSIIIHLLLVIENMPFYSCNIIRCIIPRFTCLYSICFYDCLNTFIRGPTPICRFLSTLPSNCLNLYSIRIILALTIFSRDPYSLPKYLKFDTTSIFLPRIDSWGNMLSVLLPSSCERLLVRC